MFLFLLLLLLLLLLFLSQLKRNRLWTPCLKLFKMNGSFFGANNLNPEVKPIAYIFSYQYFLAVIVVKILTNGKIIAATT